MSKQNGQPTLSDFVDARIQIAMAAMNCVGLGTIQSFDAATQTATVTMNYKRLLKDAAMAPNNIDTIDVIAEYPQLIKCPVMITNGGGAALTFPIATGDPCIVLFNDRDIDNWVLTGNTASPPNSARLHNLSDAIALVGIKSNAKLISGYDGTNVKLVFGGGYVSIDPTGNIKIESTGTIEVNSTGAMNVQSSGVLTIKGSQVSINP